MKKSNLLRKWHLLALTAIMLVVSLGVLAVPVAAINTTPSPIPAHLIVGQPWDPGTLGTYINIKFKGPTTAEDNTLPGWCVNEQVFINVDTLYAADVYDYFAYYKAYGVDVNGVVPNLPGPVVINTKTNNTINWFAVAYIINLPLTGPLAGATEHDVQTAIWYYTEGGKWIDDYNNPVTPSTKALAIVAATQIYLTANGGVFVPTGIQLRPMVCYIAGHQVIFFQLQSTLPPPPPLPELPSGALLGLGLVGLVGVGWFGYRKSHVLSES